MYSNNKLSWWLYGIGVFIVLAAHIYMLVAGLTPAQMMGHAILNLIAVAFLVTGWLKAKV
jgi:hypothetical protein